MSVPPEMMQLLSGGGGKFPAPGAGTMDQAAPGNMPPAGGPMSTPQPKEGLTQAAMVNISMVMQLLEQSLGAFGSHTPEGEAVLNALKTLTKKFGASQQKSNQLIPAELMQLMQAIPGAGGGSPAAKTMGAMPSGAPSMPTPAG